MTAIANLDLTDVETFVRGEHHGLLATLRAHDPVHWNPTGDDSGFWALTKYDDVVQAYRDHASFSSARGAIMGGSYRSEADSSSGRMLVASDLPRHRMIKHQMLPAFSTEMVRRARRQIASHLDLAFETMRANGGCDFATDIATELPAGAVVAILNVGREEAHELVRLTRMMIGFRDPSLIGPERATQFDDERALLACIQSEIFDYFEDLIRLRRRQPGDDLVSMLLRSDMNGRPMPEEDILYNCMNFAVGGNETSSYSASAGVEALIEHPDQYELLLDRPGLLPSAVEEILRWSSTACYVQRVATRDLDMRGVRIRAGDAVTLWNVSANRDEEQFRDPMRFDVQRSPNRHLTFGGGIHRCVGASVGLAELGEVFGRLVQGRIRLAVSGELRRLRSNFILGITSMPVEIVS
ncbi:cytochrome P450 [Micromonospora sp. NPDC000663]|uniref:cytochrome P450 n=1 Tax=Micromonospora sp. NPDC000663 TaxID=3364218 RepID=UPI0036B77D6A